MSTTTIESPADKPEMNVPDANLLRQLAVISRTRIFAEALTDFLADHHKRLEGLQWRVVPQDGEIAITGGFGNRSKTEAIAQLFPGVWQCGCAGLSTSYTEWTAVRNGGITIRIEFAEHVVPKPAARPIVTTF